MTRKIINILVYTLSIIYLVVVYYYTVFGRETRAESQIDLDAFQSLKDFFRFNYESHGQYILKEILINVALLMPLGLLLTCIRWNFLLVTLLGFLCSLSIEMLQYYTKTGTASLDDLIYNTAGIFLVSAILTIFQRLRNYAAKKLHYR